MIICLAQIQPLRGDIPANIEKHLVWVDVAVRNDADMMLFPELSITGYEPTLAEELAVAPDDTRFDVFQTISDTHRLTICIGAPIKTEDGITISLLVFQPGLARKIYSKQYLHPDEEPFFVNGKNTFTFSGENANLSLAICYELSVPEHAEAAFQRGAKLYMTSVAKSAKGAQGAAERLSQIAKDYSMTVLMVNCIGNCDGMKCGGRSAVWNSSGVLAGQLDEEGEGALLFDTETGDMQKKYS
jgi:predicted amidohydrolase